MAHDDILSSYEAIGLRKKLNIFYKMINPEPQANGLSGVMSGSRTNHSFEPVLFSKL